MIPPKNQMIAHQEIDDRACPNGDDIGEEIMQMHLRYEKPCQREISNDRNQPIREMKPDKTAEHSP